MGEEAFFHAGEEDEGELEAFGGVQGHEGDAGFGGVAVGVGNEGRVVEKLCESFTAGGGVLGGVGEFFEVLDAGEGFGRGFVFESADVAGTVVEELDELGEGGGVAGLAEGSRVGCVGGFVIACLGGDDAVEAGAGCGAGALLEGDGGEGVQGGGVGDGALRCVRVFRSDGADFFGGAEVEVEVEAGVEGRCWRRWRRW